MKLEDRFAVLDLAAARLARALLVLLALLAPAVPATAQDFERGLLWRVERDDAGASHLFGTMHLDDPRVTNLPEPVARAFEASRALMVEVSLDPGNVIALAERMLLQDGRTLAAITGEALFERVSELGGRLGLPGAALQMFKPWAAALFLGIPRLDPRNVLDYRLVGEAKKAGKPVHELENIHEQVEVFEGLAEADQVALLRQAVDNHERLPQLTARLVEAYLARDLAGLRRIGRESSTVDDRLQAEFEERLLRVRNGRMVDRMEPQLREGGAFVAIGALHLHGEDGVLAELERRGYRVTVVY